MQKGQPIGRISTDGSGVPNHVSGGVGTEHHGQNTASDYASGFLAGYEAGRRGSFGEDSHQRFTAGGSSGINGQRTSLGASAQRPQQGNSGFAGAQQADRGTMRNLTGRGGQQYSSSRRAPSTGIGQEGPQRYGTQSASGARRLSDGFQLRKSVDGQTIDGHEAAGMIRRARTSAQEHETNGQDTTPGTEVHYTGAGRY